MIKQPLAGISTSLLLDELCARLMRLEHAAARVRSVGRLRELVQLSYNAGELAAAAAQLDGLALRLSHVLDEATANAPEPPTTSEPNALLDAERGHRRALWLAVETLRVRCTTEAARLRTDAHRRHMHVAKRTDEALVPERPLRQRAGQWLYALGMRIGSERGAS